MKKSLLLLFLFIVPAALAFTAEELYNSDELLIQNNISNRISIIKEGGNAFIEKVNAELHAFPRNIEGQEIVSQIIVPDAALINNSLRFSWTAPKEDVLEIFVSSNIKTKERFPKITKKVSFPVVKPNISSEYLQSNSLIDADNPEIVRLANELAYGEDDLYVVEHKLADWVNKNIAYSLSTVTMEGTQSASWTLENKQGVCDELSTLFIALNRALGVPARFVSGVAYSEYFAFKENWVNHGWAEVYFPEYGWVPFDLTFKEFGYIDPAHIILDESKDANESSVNYNWKARNVELKPSKLELKTDVLGAGSRAIPSTTLSLSPRWWAVGFGSSNLIQAKIKNLQGYYVPLILKLSKTESITNYDDIERAILLKPYEEKTVNFLISVDSNLNPDYKYTFPVSIFTNEGASSEIKFVSARNEKVFSAQDFSSFLTEEESKNEIAKIILACNAEKMPYVYDNLTIKCNILNAGNVFLDNLMVCNQQCVITDVGIGKSADIILNQEFSKSGEQTIKIKASNAKVSAETKIQVTVQDVPQIRLDYQGRDRIKFDEKATLSINLTKLPGSIPKDINVNFELGSYKKSWKIAELNGTQILNLEIEGSLLKEGKNAVKINIDFKDENGRVYRLKSANEIELEKLNFFQKVIGFFKRLFRF